MTHEELKAAHNEAQKRLRELDDTPERKAAQKVAQDAAHAFYESEARERGRELRDRLIGRTVKDVRSAYSVGIQDLFAHGNRLDTGIVIVLDDDTVIEAAAVGDEADAQLEIWRH